MTHNQQKYVCVLLFGGATLTCTITAQADFLADSKGELEARNFYFNRDFRQQGARDRAEEWAQGVWCARWQKRQSQTIATGGGLYRPMAPTPLNPGFSRVRQRCLARFRWRSTTACKK